MLFEIALVDCKVLGIVRTLVEGSSARKAIELRPGEIWPDSCHSRTTQSHLTFNLTGGVLWGESTPVRPYWCGPFLPIGISGCRSALHGSLVWVLVLELHLPPFDYSLGSLLENLFLILVLFFPLDSWYSSLFRIECCLSLQTKARPQSVYWIRNGVEKGERRLALKLFKLVGS